MSKLWVYAGDSVEDLSIISCFTEQVFISYSVNVIFCYFTFLYATSYYIRTRDFVE